MWQLLKRTWWVCLLAGGVQSASAFTMLGQFDTWMVPSLSYQSFNDLTGQRGVLDSPLGGPMNLGEEFRGNISVINYAFDQNFLDYFGSSGVYAVEQAFAILNNLTNVSAYSPDLAEVPLEATRLNFRAGALGLLDLKSITLHLLAEQLALADPTRYTWTLRARAQPPGASCPVYDYLVIKRNFDPVTWQPSSYVNGSLYSYRIIELCPGEDRADAVEFLVDPMARYFTAVASAGIWDGSFFTGMTRDDIGGLRYLLRTNNLNWEDPPLNSTLKSGGFTNTAARQLLSTSNLAELVFQSFTNNPGTLQARFPGLILASTNTVTFTNVIQTNIFAFFTNFPFSPAGSPASLVLVTNLSTNVEPRFHVTFANVVTNRYYTNGITTTLNTKVGPAPFAPPGSGLQATNVSAVTGTSSFVNGDYYLVPPGLCDYSLVSTQLITVFAVTNNVTVATNAFGTTNVNGQTFTRDIVTYFTNYVFVADPIVCDTTGPTLRQGIEKISFARQSFDSLTGRFFAPVTNRFQVTMVTNSGAIVQTFERVINQPDILFTADDLVSDPTAWPIVVNYATRSIGLNSNNALPNLPGPGLVQPSTTITFEKVGPSFLNLGPFFIDEETAIPFFVWGSFDGSTNAPIVYPSGTSISDYEIGVLMQVTTSVLPGGRVSSPYSAQLQGTGGQTPYRWSLVPGSASLPPGLFLSPSGRISGTPTTAGNYGITVRLTDAGARSVGRDVSITINP